MKRELFGPHPWFFGWAPDYREPNWSPEENEFVRACFPFPSEQHAIEWFNDRVADGEFAAWRKAWRPASDDVFMGKWLTVRVGDDEPVKARAVYVDMYGPKQWETADNKIMTPPPTEWRHE